MFQRLFKGPKPRSATEPLPSEVLELQRQVQTFRLEAAARAADVERLKLDLERARRGAESQAEATVQQQISAVMRDVATPAAHLLTQAHLLEVAEQPVRAVDVVAIAKRLLHALEDHGLTIESAIAATVTFDPDRHTVLGSTVAPRAGEAVIVRVPGIAYRGVVLHKAGVERARNQATLPTKKDAVATENYSPFINYG